MSLTKAVVLLLRIFSFNTSHARANVWQLNTFGNVGCDTPPWLPWSPWRRDQTAAGTLAHCGGGELGAQLETVAPAARTRASADGDRNADLRGVLGQQFRQWKRRRGAGAESGEYYLTRRAKYWQIAFGRSQWALWQLLVLDGNLRFNPTLTLVVADNRHYNNHHFRITAFIPDYPSNSVQGWAATLWPNEAPMMIVVWNIISAQLSIWSPLVGGDSGFYIIVIKYKLYINNTTRLCGCFSMVWNMKNEARN